MSWVGLTAAMLTGVALLGVLAPFTRSRNATVRPLARSLEDRRLRILRSLRDLERDHARGAVADEDYENLRRQAEAEAVQLIRGVENKEQAAELAATVRKPRLQRRGDRRRGLSNAQLVGGLAALALGATAVPLLLGGVGERSAGGFITGAQPSSSPPGSATPLQQRVQDHPNDLEARLDLAQTYLESGRPRDASQQYVEVLKRDPNNPEATTRLALLVYEAGDPDDALKGVEKVLIQHPDYPEALFLKGVILLNAEKRPQDAIAPLQRYLQVAPTGGYRADADQLLKEAQAQGS
jgi:cytochrome c-type biogenesis protein CcmH/NrfG